MMPVTDPGCAMCGSLDTVTVDGVCGRRCVQHPPQFSPDRAVKLLVAGMSADAFSYCRTDFPGVAA